MRTASLGYAWSQAFMVKLNEEWIAALSSPEDGARAAAARQIYAAGRSRAEQAIQRWREHDEFARLLGKTPEITVGLAVRPETFAQIPDPNGWPRLAEVPPQQHVSQFTLHFPSG